MFIHWTKTIFYINWENTKNNKNAKNCECIDDRNNLNDIIKNVDNNTILILKTKDFDISSISCYMTTKTFGEYSIILDE